MIVNSFAVEKGAADTAFATGVGGPVWPRREEEFKNRAG